MFDLSQEELNEETIVDRVQAVKASGYKWIGLSKEQKAIAPELNGVEYVYVAAETDNVSVLATPGLEVEVEAPAEQAPEAVETAPEATEEAPKAKATKKTK